MGDETAKLNRQAASVSEKPLLCSVSSRNADEQLFGTISQTQVWFLLEYLAPPSAKAMEDSDIPQRVKDYLSKILKSVPQSRLLLIRQKSAFSNGTGPTFFVATGSETDPGLYEFHLDRYETLLDLDLSRLISNPEAYEKQRRETPLFLVCTNGRRDPCCARWGAPAFEGLARAAGNDGWQSSHIGGHRFAANVLCFPHGIGYGRVDQGEIENLVSDYRRGQIVMANYRGRASYPPAAQAAEIYLRSQTGNSQVAAYRLESSQEVEPGTWAVSFRSLPDRTGYRLEITSGLSDYEIYESCDSAEPKALTFFQLQKIEELFAGDLDHE